LHFPVWIPLGPLRIHPHPVFESLGYFLGYRLYLWQRRHPAGGGSGALGLGDALPDLQRLIVLAAAALGGAIGSKLLAGLEDPALTLAHLRDLSFLLAGQSIVGGLLGGLLAVELVKGRIGLRTATGDLYALPLTLAIAVGRIGCFLTGLADDTSGVATRLPWGIDFGDGIPRHPTQLYEIAFLLLLGLLLWRRARQPHTEGDLFKLFMVGYLGWRLLVDAIKPYHHVLFGLCTIQLACLAGLLYYAPHIPRLLRWKGEPAWQTR